MKYAVCLILWALLLVSCGDSSVGDDVNGNNLAVYSTVEDLPPCTTVNEGEQLFVKSEGIIRVCTDKKWFATMHRLGGCTTEPLSDSSGVKILCDGDSVGVVLNGKNGTNGRNGTSTTLPDTSKNGIVVLDSEKVATSLEGVSGYSQKGPFINGSKVTVIELESGRSLNQTGNTFESKIQSDDGQFKLNARMMVSQYVELHAEGYYRNEVTGKNSEAPLTLYAVTDVSKREGGVVNINLLTHLEYFRVIHLVKEKKMKVFAAKDSAEKEIFNLLDINSKGFFSSEDLNIAGSSEGDAALLAFSVMLQGDRSVSQLTELLASISSDMELDGTWDDAEKKMEIAEWAADADSAGLLASIRTHVTDWKLSVMVPNFEKYIRSFWTKEYGLGECSGENLGAIKSATAGKAKNSRTRFLCIDSAGVGYMWRVATIMERNLHGVDGDFSDSDVRAGAVDTDSCFVFENGVWRLGTSNDCSLQVKGCTMARQDLVLSAGQDWYKCDNRQWRFATDIEKDTVGWGEGFTEGYVRNGQVNGEKVYVFEDNHWRSGTALDSLLNKRSCIADRVGDTSSTKYEQLYYVCSEYEESYAWITAPDIYNDTYEIRSQCGPTTVHQYNNGQLINGRVNNDIMYVCDADTFRVASEFELLANRGCVSYLYYSGILAMPQGQYSYYECTSKGWTFTLETLYDWFVLQDSRDSKKYPTIGIKTQLWMAKNLNYETSNSYCYNGQESFCEGYGRLYVWDDEVMSNICPEGWHLPSKEEFETLIDAVGGADEAGLHLKSTTGWANSGMGWSGNGNGTDDYGFSALPVGMRNNGGGIFGGEELLTYMWSSTPYNEYSMYSLYLHAGRKSAEVDLTGKGYGISIRCVKD